MGQIETGQIETGQIEAGQDSGPGPDRRGGRGRGGPRRRGGRPDRVGGEPVDPGDSSGRGRGHRGRGHGPGGHRARRDEARELRRLALQLDGAISQVAQVATTEQLVRSAAIVAESRRRLYALLAEDPTTPS